MLSVIEVQCPHCGVRGQLMLPPVGALIVGPCPECDGLVVVFGGRVLPLDKDIMLNASFEEKRQHLMAVLTDFLEDRVVQLLNQVPDAGEAPDAVAEIEGDGLAQADDESPAGGRDAISASEKEAFVQIDLDLIDNPDYFRAIFG